MAGDWIAWKEFLGDEIDNIDRQNKDAMEIALIMSLFSDEMLEKVVRKTYLQLQIKSEDMMKWFQEKVKERAIYHKKTAGGK